MTFERFGLEEEVFFSKLNNEALIPPPGVETLERLLEELSVLYEAHPDVFIYAGFGFALGMQIGMCSYLLYDQISKKLGREIPSSSSSFWSFVVVGEVVGAAVGGVVGSVVEKSEQGS